MKQRNLLATNDFDDGSIIIQDKNEEEYPFNCINGYYSEKSIICICYPGWTSDFLSLNQCDIDTGENLTKLNKDTDIRDIGSSNSDKNKNNKKENSFDIMAGMAISSVVLLIILLIIFCILTYICKKFKKSKLKQNETNNNKNKIKKSEISLELGSNTIKKDEDNNNSFNSKTIRDNSNHTLNNVEMVINFKN